MFRTLTLSAAALVAATTFASANDIFVSLAMQDDDRAAVRALTQGDVAPGGSTEIFAQIAKQDDDRAGYRAIKGTSSQGVAFSTKGSPSASLEAAYKHAVETDNRPLAKHLAEKLGL